MGRRGKKVGPMGGKWNISHSLQMRLALGYSCLIAVLLVLMNTYTPDYGTESRCFVPSRPPWPTSWF